MKVVVLSKSRSNSICTHDLLNNGQFDLVVPEDQIANYELAVINAAEIIGYPTHIEGLGELRNWVLDYYDDEAIVMLDDDIRHFMQLMDMKAEKITYPDHVHHILEQTAICAFDAGTNLWSLNQMADVRKYSHCDPFTLNTWVGTIVGVIGRERKFTEVNKLKVDADFTLKTLKEDRIVWVDNRYSFSCARDTNSGGNSEYRTQERLDREIDFLRRKWGSHIKITKKKEKYGLKLNVKRRQRMKLDLE